MNTARLASVYRHVPRPFLLGIVLAVAFFAPETAHAQENWTQQSPITVPPGRYYHAIVYDALHSQDVMFGGAVPIGGGYPYTNSNYDGRTWVWDGTNWTGLTPSPAPAPRSSAMMAYDSVNHKTVLFGGYTNGTGSTASGYVVNDTWIWDGSTWTQMSPAVSPSPRMSGAMAYDATNMKVVLFGGEDLVNGYFADTWVYDVPTNTWTNVTPSPSPVSICSDGTAWGRRWSSMAYDAARNNVVLFGGEGCDNAELGDTWTWNGSQWTLAATTGPPARAGQAMGYDPVDMKVLMFGGFNPANYNLADTWIWDGTWTQLMPTTIPPGRENGAMAFDYINQEMMMFGGSEIVGNWGNDTWLFGGSSSSQTAVTINVPSGIQFTFNGVSYLGSHTINIAPGTYTLSTVSPQSTGAGTQAVWSSWSDSGAQSHTVTVGSSAISITGNYNTQYLLTTAASPSAGGSVSPLSGYYDSGAIVGVSEIANAGYTFASWSGDCSGSGACSVTMSAPRTVTGNFTATGIALVTINVPTGIQFSLNGITYTGSTTVPLALGSYPLSTDSPQSMSPLSQLVFVSWSDGGAQSHQLSVTGTMTVTGVFKTQYRLTAIASPDLDGTVTPFIPGPYYDAGTLVIVQAQPNPGFDFDFWGGDCSGSSLACIVTMSAPHQVVGHFGTPQNWVQLLPSKHPQPRAHYAMAYDAAHKQVVLFGGLQGSPLTSTNNTVLGDTWLWDGSTWTRQNPVNSPSPRWGAMMAYDAAHGQVVLFGGRPDNGSLASAGLSDTWVWDLANNTWTLKSTNGPARYEGSMAYDASSGKVILFGGGSYNQTLRDTWAWNGAAWNLLNSSGPIRAGAALAYDFAHQNLVLFGGGDLVTLTGQIAYTDRNVFVWDGAEWIEKGPAVHPPNLLTPTMAYNPDTQEVLLFGEGAAADGTPNSQTWAWDGSNFYEKMSVNSPSPRIGESMVYDAARDQILMFGGVDITTGRVFSDTWAWLTPNVTLVPKYPSVTTDGSGNYVVTMNLANQGNVPDSAVILSSATLGPVTSSSNGFIGVISPGATGSFSVKFKISASLPQFSVQSVTFQGSYNANGVTGIPWSGTFSVLLP